jgi:hypothetical protein
VRGPIVAWLIGIAVVAAIAGAGRELFSHTQAARFQEVRSVARSPSDIRLSMTVDYTRGPVARERYTMIDHDGNSDASYAVTDRAGTIARFHESSHGYDVSFLFDRLVADGIWELTDKPPAGDTSIRYTVRVAQIAQNQHGARVFSFSDPHYWATTAGRQYHIHLDPKQPTPDLLKLASTAIADPRYERVVADFRSFGSPKFQATIRKARERLGLPS